MWLHHPCLLGVRMVGKDQYAYITPAFSGSPWLGNIKMATSPMPFKDAHSGERSKWLHHPCLLRVPIVGKDQYVYISRASSGSAWWGNINMVASPVPSRGPHAGERSIWLHQPWLLRVPMVGKDQNGYMTPAFLGVPIVGKDQYAYISPTFSGSAWWGNINMIASPVPSRGPHSGERSIWLHHRCPLRVPMVGKHQYGCITPAF